ncbi:mate-domain-containing protein [Fennellomyces sp. T-0311]|nr:mate-domain-containing protein [Fennellomyces sp. T-0311]
MSNPHQSSAFIFGNSGGNAPLLRSSTETKDYTKLSNRNLLDVEVQKQENGTPPLSTQAIIQELKELVRISNPVILTYMLQYSLQTGSVLVVGRLGAEELAASVFAFMFATVTGWLLALGGTTALDTMGSQLWGASSNSSYAEKRSEMNILLQRTCIVLILCFVPVAVLWYYVEPVLRLLGQDALLCKNVQTFLRFLIPGTPAYIGFEAIKKYLQAQGTLIHASTFTLLLCSPLNVFINYLFVYNCDLGFIGAAVGTSVTHWIMLFMLLGIMHIIGDNKSKNAQWDLLPIHRRAFTEWKPFLGMAISGMLALGTEYIAFEIITVLVGLLESSTTLAAQSIIVIADDILCTIPLGVSVATTTRVGLWVGRGLPKHAKMAAIVSLAYSMCIGISITIIMLACKDSFGFLFTKDTAVDALVSKVMPCLVIFQLADAISGASSGALRGMGCQHWSASVNLICYYVFALPLGAFLAFGSPRLELIGLWSGLVAGLISIAAIQTVVILRVNWQRQIDLYTVHIQK